VRGAKGSNALIALLALLYALFWWWYGGTTSPLTQQEVDGFMKRLPPDLQVIYRSLAAQDDGREFYMVNFTRYKAKATFPDDPRFAGYDNDVWATDRRYIRGILFHLLKRAAYPVFAGVPQSPGFVVATEPELTIQGHETGPWHRMFIVRHRSRRDFLDLITDPGMRPVGVLKWATVAKTEVFPAAPWVSATVVKGVAALGFGALGILLHAILRRFRWYQPAHR
jgi:hypothetical protein